MDEKGPVGKPSVAAVPTGRGGAAERAEAGRHVPWRVGELGLALPGPFLGSMRDS